MGAKRCKHCQQDLPASGKGWLSLRKYDRFRIGFFSGVAFSLTLAVLVWFHFFDGGP